MPSDTLPELPPEWFRREDESPDDLPMGMFLRAARMQGGAAPSS